MQSDQKGLVVVKVKVVVKVVMVIVKVGCQDQIIIPKFSNKISIWQKIDQEEVQATLLTIRV